MDTIERMEWPRAGGATVGDLREYARVPLEVVLLSLAVGFAVIGPLTHLVWCAAVTSVLATAVTLRRLRAEVRELRGESEQT